jgi:hypothetical protein
MKLVIAGSRDIPISIDFVLQAIYHFNIEPIEIVCGACPTGPDATGAQIAKMNGLPLKEFPAEWEKYGNRAGPLRNNKMAAYGNALLLIWDGVSKGSQSMKNAMVERKKPIYEIKISKYNIPDEHNSGT